MMEIFLCEDDEKQCQTLKKKIENLLLFKNYEATLQLATTKPEELLQSLKTGDFGEKDLLFFLDIDLKSKMDGLQLAQEIKSLYPKSKIVFITSHQEWMSLVFRYQVEALDYLDKKSEELEDRLSEDLDIAFERFKKVDPIEKITIQSEGKQLILPLHDILFFDSSSKAHRIQVHLFNRQVDFYGKIKDLPQLSPNFLRVHQSYVVNLKNVAAFDASRRELIMKNQEICYVSTRYVKQIKMALQ